MNKEEKMFGFWIPWYNLDSGRGSSAHNIDTLQKYPEDH